MGRLFINRACGVHQLTVEFTFEFSCWLSGYVSIPDEPRRFEDTFKKYDAGDSFTPPCDDKPCGGEDDVPIIECGPVSGSEQHENTTQNSAMGDMFTKSLRQTASE